MPSRTATDLELIPRYRQLACEVVHQVVQDVKALNRRGFLRGLNKTGQTEQKAYRCLGYKEPGELDEFIDSIRGEPVRAWLVAAGEPVSHEILVEKLEKITPESAKPTMANRKEIT